MAEGKKIGSMFIEFMVKSEGFKRGMAEAKRSMTRFRSVLNKIGNGAVNVFKRMTKAVFNWKVALIAIVPAMLAIRKAFRLFKGFVKGIIDISSTFEQYRETLKVLSSDADKMFNRLMDKAKETSMTLKDYIGAAIPLIPSFGEGKLFDRVLNSVADLSSGLKSLGVDAMQVVRVFLKIKGGNFGEAFERLREWGFNLQELLPGYEPGKQFKGDPTKVLKAILGGIEKDFGGLAKKMAKTWAGMVSNLIDWWDKFRDMVGLAGFFDAAKAKLKGILNLIDQWDKDGRLKEWAKYISEKMTSVLNGVTEIGKKIAELFGGLDTPEAKNMDIGILVDEEKLEKLNTEIAKTKELLAQANMKEIHSEAIEFERKLIELQTEADKLTKKLSPDKTVETGAPPWAQTLIDAIDSVRLAFKEGSWEELGVSIGEKISSSLVTWSSSPGFKTAMGTIGKNMGVAIGANLGPILAGVLAGIMGTNKVPGSYDEGRGEYYGTRHEGKEGTGHAEGKSWVTNQGYKYNEFGVLVE